MMHATPPDFLERPLWRELTVEQRLAIIREGFRQGLSVRLIAAVAFTDASEGQVSRCVREAGGKDRVRFGAGAVDPVAGALFNTRTIPAPKSAANFRTGGIAIPHDRADRLLLAGQLEGAAEDIGVEVDSAWHEADCLRHLAALLRHTDGLYRDHEGPPPRQRPSEPERARTKHPEPRPRLELRPAEERLRPLFRQPTHAGRPTLISATLFQCRWPEWEEGAAAGALFVCGAPVVREGCSWCGEHRARATRPYAPGQR